MRCSTDVDLLHAVHHVARTVTQPNRHPVMAHPFDQPPMVMAQARPQRRRGRCSRHRPTPAGIDHIVENPKVVLTANSTIALVFLECKRRP